MKLWPSEEARRSQAHRQPKEGSLPHSGYAACRTRFQSGANDMENIFGSETSLSCQQLKTEKVLGRSTLVVSKVRCVHPRRYARQSFGGWEENGVCAVNKIK